LSNKRLIRLAGPDATNFLHDLIPAKILGVGTDPIYTAFLTAHGRIISDAFIYPPSWSSGSSESGTHGQAHKAKEFEWWIEADEAGQDILAKHFRKHKLRAKFAMEKIKPDAVQIIYEWPSVAMSPSSPKTPIGWRAGGKDPRPGMGHRFIIDNDRLSGAFSAPEAQEASLEDYTVHRMLNGLAEGHSEIISEHALPQESNIDIIGGIDFHKGCYLGQELTIRTHHTGVVRKRILPCQIYDESASLPEAQRAPVYDPDAPVELPPPESNMTKASSRRKGRSTGKWLGGVGNIGLALCRLEMMTDIQLTADTTNYDPNEEYKVQWATGEEGGDTRNVRLKPFVPAWLQHGIEQNLKRKEKKPPKPRDEDEEEEDDVH
jgi:folate-binding protein YgfZ